MAETKQKNDSPPIKTLPFVALWFLVGLLTSLILSAFRSTNPNSYLTAQQILIAIFLLGTPLLALFQVQLIERVFKRSMRGWLVFNLIGAMISLFLITRSWSATSTSYQAMILFMQAAAFAPTPLLQTFWLWRRAKKAWLWPLVSFVAIVLGYQVRPLGADTPLPQMIVSVSVTLILGLLMHYFLTHPKNTEKAKLQAMAADDSALDQARLARLQDAEETDPARVYTDNQTIQRDTL